MKKVYLVEVTTQSGEIEKSVKTLVEAITADDAGIVALKAELHCEIGEGAEWTGSGVEDLNGEWHYSVSRIHSVKKDHEKILKTYMTCFK